MSIWRKSFALFVNQWKMLTLVFLCYYGWCIFSLYKNEIFPSLFNLILFGAMQGWMLKQGLGIGSSYLLPKHNEIQLVNSFYLALLVVIPPSLAHHYFIGSQLIDITSKFLFIYYVAAGLAYYRNGVLTSVLIYIGLGIAFVDKEWFKIVVLHYVPYIWILYLSASAAIAYLLLKAMNEKELDTQASTEFYRSGFGAYNIAAGRAPSTEAFLGRQTTAIANTLNQYLLELSLRRRFLHRLFAAYNSSALQLPLFALVTTIINLLIVVLMRVANIDKGILLIILIMPLIVIVAPFFNELSENRKQLSNSWLRDAAATRKRYMQNVAVIHLMRLFFPMLMWLIVLGSGYFLIEDQSNWDRVFLLIVSYFPICVALCFANGLINKSGAATVNTGFTLVHVVAMVTCFLVAIFLPGTSWLIFAGASVLAFVLVNSWIKQDIEVT